MDILFRENYNFWSSIAKLEEKFDTHIHRQQWR
jgi:hypothetical protein